MSIKNNFPTISPSLNLDFANSKQVDPRITFTRASTATYWDGKTVALAEQNLLTYSQDFNNAAWNAPSVTKTANVAAAPDGTMTADRLVGNTSLWYAQQAPSLVVGAQYTISVYVMSNNGSSQLFRLYGSSSILSGDLTATTSWQRFSFTFTATASLGCGIARQSAGGVNDLLVWGFQLEQRSQATAYTPTTDQPITKYQPILQTAASGTARFDHNPVTGESLGLLIEEQRTNLVIQTTVGTGWNVQNVTRYSNNITAPDGTLTGTTLQASAGGFANRGCYQAITVTSGAVYTASAYFKAGTYSYVYIGGSSFNVSNGTIITVVSGGSASIASVGNGWYRCISTYTEGSTVDYVQTYFSQASGGNAMTATGSETIHVWGAQLEAGAFPTSYIPTTTAQVTRAADAASITGTNFSSWYRQDEGTLFAQAYPQATMGNSVSNDLVEANDGTQANYFGTAAGLVQGYQADQLVSVAASAVSRAKNGVVTAVAYPTDQPPKTTLQIGVGRIYYRVPGWYKRIAYYPKRLSNTELQALTT